MSSFWTKVLGDKKEWRSMEARADALPRDYRIMYGKIKPYLFGFTTGDGLGTMAVLRDVLAAFETGAAQGKRALDVTGEDVAAFCDERLRGAPSYSYVDKGRASLNRDVAKRLGPAGRQS
jgi:DNA-binding ferritin-like protein (Dps family)